jgi:hypothetical protein
MPESHEAVAFELMKWISERDVQGVKNQSETPRKYYLELYNECLETVRGDFEDSGDE